MPAHSPALRRSTARAGAAVRWAHPDADQARRDLVAERISAYIQRVLADAPPLSDAQRERLALLLRGPSVGQRSNDGLMPGQPPQTNRVRGRLALQDAEGQR